MSIIRETEGTADPLSRCVTAIIADSVSVTDKPVQALASPSTWF